MQNINMVRARAINTSVARRTKAFFCFVPIAALVMLAAPAILYPGSFNLDTLDQTTSIDPPGYPAPEASERARLKREQEERRAAEAVERTRLDAEEREQRLATEAAERARLKREEGERAAVEAAERTRLVAVESKGVLKEVVTRADRKRVYTVHLWDDGSIPTHGQKEKMYNKEGWSTHPQTTLVDSPENADIIVWVTVRSGKEIPPLNYSNVVLLDYADGCTLHQLRGELKHIAGYFKRSFVKRVEGVYAGNCSGTTEEHVYPLAYSGAVAIVNRNTTRPRTVSITNVLRSGGADHNTGRAKIINWTKAFIQQHGLSNTSVVGEVSTGWSGGDWNAAYMEHLARSKIIVTSNPWRWEGDFRLWEALSAGVMVLVDKMVILDYMPFPFEHKTHLVFYDSTNQTEFEELLWYYVQHEEEAREIAMAGYHNVLEHHMTTDRVTYILDSIESKLV